MTSYSIRDLLRLALPFGTTLLTGEQTHTRQLDHVVSLRAVLPAFPRLYGGEIVLFSVRDALTLDDQLTLPNIIRRLAEVRVAAIAFVGDAEPAAVTAADELNLPLLRLPLESNLKNVQQDVLYLLTNPELQLERRAAQLYRDLTQHVVDAGGTNAVLRAAGEATRRVAAFFDAAGQLSAAWGTGPDRSAIDQIDPRALAGARLNGHPAVVKAVGPAHAPLGFIVFAGPSLAGWDDLAAGQAAAALLLELNKQQAVQAVESRIGGELLHSIVSGIPADMIALRERAGELGYDLRRPHVALLIAPANDRAAIHAIYEALERELRFQNIAAPYVARDDAVLCLYPTDSAGDAQAELLEKLGRTVPIGAGLSAVAATAADWPRAFKEAERALALGRHLFGPRSFTRSDSLHIYRLLFELRGSPELWSFCNERLSALVEYDRRHDAGLLATLEAYFAAQANLSRAAERLHVHRNTLLYRLRRIGQISGIDMECPEDMLALQVALKAHRVLTSTALDDG